MVLTMNSNSIIQMEKDRGRSVQRKKRRDLRSMLGPTWGSQELFCFYNAYRKYGTDWLKVGAELHEVRSKDMLEALYSMNKAYLSLQEGIATVGGFIAIVVDRCKFLEESDGDKGQVNEHQVSPYTANGDEKTISCSQVPESREKQTSRSMHQNESTSSHCRRKPFASRSFQLSNPENNKLRKLLQEDERVGIACEALLDLSTTNGIR